MDIERAKLLSPFTPLSLYTPFYGTGYEQALLVQCLRMVEDPVSRQEPTSTNRYLAMSSVPHLWMLISKWRPWRPFLLVRPRVTWEWRKTFKSLTCTRSRQFKTLTQCSSQGSATTLTIPPYANYTLSWRAYHWMSDFINSCAGYGKLETACHGCRINRLPSSYHNL